MDDERFYKYLKKKGKKEHVIRGLMKQVADYEAALSQQGKTLAGCSAQDLDNYLASLEVQAPGAAREAARGIALYFAASGCPELAAHASSVREHAIAKTRRHFPLDEFRGVGSADLERLASAGIRDANQMVATGSTPRSRQELAERTGVAVEAILDLVKLSDLARIEGVKGIRARLYVDGGYDTLDKLAISDPETMRLALVEFIKRTGFEGIVPLPKEVAFAVNAARELPHLVDYG